MLIIQMVFFASYLLTQVNCHKKKKSLPPGAVSKEEHIQIDSVMSFDPASDVPGSRSATGYLRNLEYTTSYPHSPDRAITFPGQKTSYMFLPNTDGTFDGSDMGSWWFYIFPDPGFTYGCIIEYESTCPSGNGMSIRFKDNKIEFSGTLSNGRSFYGLSKTNIPSGQWTYIGVMWHEVYPEIRVNINGQTLESAAIVTLNSGVKFMADSTVRVGASFDINIPPFQGRIGCLLFQKGYYLKSKLTPEDYCDPGLRSSMFPVETVTTTELTGPLTSGCGVVTPAPTIKLTVTPPATNTGGTVTTVGSTIASPATTPSTTPFITVFTGFSNTGVLVVEEVCSTRTV